MQENQQSVLEKLQELLKQKRSKSDYANKLGITIEEVNELLKELRTKPQEEAEIGNYVAELEERVVENDIERGKYKSSISIDYEPKTVEELYELHRIDAKKYKISTYWSKLKSNGKFTSSILATLIKDEFSEESFADYLKHYKSPYIPYVENRNTNGLLQRAPVDVVLSIADFHLDKLTINEETIKQRKTQYKDTLTNLLEQAYIGYNLNKIVFIVGNDLFHTDNIHNTTTNLTPQQVNVTWNKAYEEGFDLMVYSIATLKRVCKELNVVLIQGNHERTKSYYLAHALEQYFKADKNITFDRRNSNIKHIVLGETFIGFHHGNTKIDDLPLIFATSQESSKAFGNATYREVLTGDKHYYLAKEIKGVRVQQLPSLSGTDMWHNDNNFINQIRAALLLVYHPTKGKCAEFEERP
jgi:hypothetical protein